jgi:Family of unknown function (DUF6491)
MFRSIGAPLLGLAATATVLSLSIPASADDAAPRKSSCAFVGQINNFKEIDDHSAIIETSPSRRYKVTFFNSCREMKWALFARVESHGGMCLRTGDKIVVGRHGFADHCVVRTVERLPAKQHTASNAP